MRGMVPDFVWPSGPCRFGSEDPIQPQLYAVAAETFGDHEFLVVARFQVERA
jgi:hypothetical protein